MSLIKCHYRIHADLWYLQYLYILAKLTNQQSTSLNQSYIVATSSDLSSTGGIDSTGRYQYTICPCSADVCRIRFDFTVNKEYDLKNMDYISKWFYFWCINPSMIFLCFVFKDFDLAGPYTNVGTQKADSTMLTANDGSGK